MDEIRPKSPDSANAHATKPSATGLAGPATPATFDTASLFTGGLNEVRLLHRGQEYRLRVTRQGKLILTK